MMEKVILIGYFIETAELCKKCGCIIAGVVDRSYKGEFPYLGDDESFIRNYSDYIDIPLVITPDGPGVRSRLFEKYRSLGFRFKTLIAPDAVISESAKISEGCMIQSLCNISSNTVLGSGVRVNTGANIMHDVNAGSFSVIAPNAVVLGYVSIGDKAYIGANSTILPQIKIGDEAVVGAGAVVIKDVPDHTVVAGVPAHTLNK